MTEMEKKMNFKTTVFLIVFSVILIFSDLSAALNDSICPKTDAEEIELNNNIIAFLKNPLALQSFKLKKGSSNSGIFKSEVHLPLFKPDKKGFYYQYMLFRTPRNLSEQMRFEGLRIIVYKIGTAIGKYSNSNEIMVGLKSRYNDPDLGKANLVGLSVDAIIKKFGHPKIKKNNFIVYYHQNKILYLKINNKKIEWFKYFHLDSITLPIKLEEILLKIKFFSKE